MRETYWDQFMATGRVEDYLNYKMKAEPHGSGSDLTEKQNAAGNGSGREWKRPGICGNPAEENVCGGEYRL